MSLYAQVVLTVGGVLLLLASAALSITSLVFLGMHGSQDPVFFGTFVAYVVCIGVLLFGTSILMCCYPGEELNRKLLYSFSASLTGYAFLAALIQLANIENVGDDKDVFVPAAVFLGICHALLLLYASVCLVTEPIDNYFFAGERFLGVMLQYYIASMVRMGIYGVDDSAFKITVGILAALHVPILVVAVTDAMKKVWRDFFGGLSVLCGLVALQMLIAAIVSGALWGGGNAAFHVSIGLFTGLLAATGIFIFIIFLMDAQEQKQQGTKSPFNGAGSIVQLFQVHGFDRKFEPLLLSV